MKNTEGYDRIPQRIIIDGLESLGKPLEKLFAMIYRDKKVLGQWLISKIIPVHKKGDKNVLRTIDLWRICAVFQKFLRNLFLKESMNLK